MSAQLTLDGMLKVIDTGEGPSGWRELLEDVAHSHCGIENLASVLRTSARVLDEFFPGRRWSWQDFDQFLADHVLIYYRATDRFTLESERFRLLNLDDESGKILVKVPASLDAVTR